MSDFCYPIGLLSELKGAPIEGFLWGFPRLDLGE